MSEHIWNNTKNEGLITHIISILERGDHNSLVWNKTLQDIWYRIFNCDATSYLIWDKIWEDKSFYKNPVNLHTHAIFSATIGILLIYDYGYLLETELSEVELLSKLGNDFATLMLPICIILSKEKYNEYSVTN